MYQFSSNSTPSPSAPLEMDLCRFFNCIGFEDCHTTSHRTVQFSTQPPLPSSSYHSVVVQFPIRDCRDLDTPSFFRSPHMDLTAVRSFIFQNGPSCSPAVDLPTTGILHLSATVNSDGTSPCTVRIFPCANFNVLLVCLSVTPKRGSCLSNELCYR